MLRRYFLGNTNLAWHGVLLVGKPFSKSRSARLEKIMEAEMMGVGSLSRRKISEVLQVLSRILLATSLEKHIHKEIIRASDF